MRVRHDYEGWLSCFFCSPLVPPHPLTEKKSEPSNESFLLQLTILAVMSLFWLITTSGEIAAAGINFQVQNFESALLTVSSGILAISWWYRLFHVLHQRYSSHAQMQYTLSPTNRSGKVYLLVTFDRREWFLGETRYLRVFQGRFASLFLSAHDPYV